MAEKDNRNLLIPPQGGMFRDLALRLKLIWNLMTDKRVNIFLKLIPIASPRTFNSGPPLFPGLIEASV